MPANKQGCAENCWNQVCTSEVQSHCLAIGPDEVWRSEVRAGWTWRDVVRVSSPL